MIEDVYYKPKAFIKKAKEICPEWDINLEWNNQKYYNKESWAEFLDKCEAAEWRVDY